MHWPSIQEMIDWVSNLVHTHPFFSGLFGVMVAGFVIWMVFQVIDDS